MWQEYFADSLFWNGEYYVVWYLLSKIAFALTFYDAIWLTH